MMGRRPLSRVLVERRVGVEITEETVGVVVAGLVGYDTWLRMERMGDSSDKALSLSSCV